jgi:hypothetical protein
MSTATTDPSRAKRRIEAAMPANHRNAASMATPHDRGESAVAGQAGNQLEGKGQVDGGGALSCAASRLKGERTSGTSSRKPRGRRRPRGPLVAAER